MIDFECGEVIHIDYNLCFEKGKKLRVSEISSWCYWSRVCLQDRMRKCFWSFARK
ncbi:hypothetical protein C2G38_2314209 [Gigaspora rosea]|uniref:Uncharacterized protein n=1 Tax=Gigaspora rosea TaxID=44941 RepID=A0A397TPU9_9GLOM|nr:hypothetical protein C2G38_2314209 [Gigaspora rosea]